MFLLPLYNVLIAFTFMQGEVKVDDEPSENLDTERPIIAETKVTTIN